MISGSEGHILRAQAGHWPLEGIIHCFPCSSCNGELTCSRQGPLTICRQGNLQVDECTNTASLEVVDASLQGLDREPKAGLHVPAAIGQWQRCLQRFGLGRGCPRTRKSTSGGAVMLGQHIAKHWSSTQASGALRSGEAELAGVVRGTGRGLGYQALLSDPGIQAPLHVWTNGSAAIGICSQQCHCKM